MSRARAAGLAVSLIVIFSAWIAIPTTEAGFLALDHPGWSRTDHGVGEIDKLTANEMSWWPPGHRYEWVDADTGNARSVVDPWDTISAGHWWTFQLLVAAALVTVGFAWRPMMARRRRIAPTRVL